MSTITYNDLAICAGLINEIRDAQERTSRLRSHLERCTPQLSATGDRHTNTHSDKFADTMQQIMDMEIASGGKIAAYMEHVQIVTDAIDQMVSDPTQRRILNYRFVDGLCWDEICARTFFTRQWCSTLCNMGLDAMGLRRKRKRRRKDRT